MRSEDANNLHTSKELAPAIRGGLNVKVLLIKGWPVTDWTWKLTNLFVFFIGPVILFFDFLQPHGKCHCKTLLSPPPLIHSMYYQSAHYWLLRYQLVRVKMLDYTPAVVR